MTSDIDVRVAAVAGRQHGVFSASQAVEAGANSALISRRVRSGRWLRLGPGVYAVAGSPETWARAVSTAVHRVAGPTAASHRTAAHLHGLYGRPRRIEVVTTSTGLRNIGFVIHQCLDLTPNEIMDVSGIPTTDIARTIIDIGVPAGIDVTQRVLDGALRREMTTLEQVAERIHRYGRKGRRGIGPARALVVERLGWDKVTESVLEDAFLRLAARAGLPQPSPQRRLVLRHGRRVVRLDFDFEGRVAVELDSEKYHTDPTTFQDDRRRQNAMVNQGLVVLRFTWWDVMAAPDYVVATIATALTRATV